MAADAILDFQNVKMLGMGRVKRAKMVAVPNFVTIGQTVLRHGHFLFFKMAAAAILDFQKVEILGVGRIKMDKMRHRAEFRGNQSNRCRNMAIFRFFQDGGRPPSWICGMHEWTTNEGHLVVIIAVQNLIRINTVVSIICKF